MLQRGACKTLGHPPKFACGLFIGKFPPILKEGLGALRSSLPCVWTGHLACSASWGLLGDTAWEGFCLKFPGVL